VSIIARIVEEADGARQVEGTDRRGGSGTSDFWDAVVQFVIEPESASQSREEDLDIHAE